MQSAISTNVYPWVYYSIGDTCTCDDYIFNDDKTIQKHILWINSKCCTGMEGFNTLYKECITEISQKADTVMVMKLTNKQQSTTLICWHQLWLWRLRRRYQKSYALQIHALLYLNLFIALQKYLAMTTRTLIETTRYCFSFQIGLYT